MRVDVINWVNFTMSLGA